MASWRQDKSPKSGSVMKPQSVAIRIMTRRGWKNTAPKSSDNMSIDADWKPLWNAGYRSGVGLQLSPGLVLSHQPWADRAGNGSELQQRSTTVNRERMKTSEGGRGARKRGKYLLVGKGRGYKIRGAGSWEAPAKVTTRLLSRPPHIKVAHMGGGASVKPHRARWQED